MLLVKKLHENARLPEKAHQEDLGFDLFSNENVIVGLNETKLVGTGISVEPPTGYGFFIKDRSSMAWKNLMITSGGVIDPGYRGEIKIIITNIGTSSYQISEGDKIAQMVPIKTQIWEIVEIDEVQETHRSNKGFGSSGK